MSRMEWQNDSTGQSLPWWDPWWWIWTWKSFGKELQQQQYMIRMDFCMGHCPTTSPHLKPLMDINQQLNTFNHADVYVSCLYVRNPDLPAANSWPALLKDAFVDTPTAPRFIAYGYPLSLTKCTNPETLPSLKSNRISLRFKWIFVNHLKVPLSNQLSTQTYHLRTPQSQNWTPTLILIYPLKTSRIGYYNNQSQSNQSQTNPSPINSSKRHHAHAPHHHTCQEALPMIHLKTLIKEIEYERYLSNMASVPMQQPLPFPTNQLPISKQPPAMMLTYGKLLCVTGVLMLRP